MAVRKRDHVEPTERSGSIPADLNGSLNNQPEELTPPEDFEFQYKRLAEALARESVTKEWVKGGLALVALSGGLFLIPWNSKTEGFTFWLEGTSGLVIFCIGLAYFAQLIKLLIAGDLSRATISLMKGFEIKEWMRAFSAFLSIGAGICFVLKAQELAYYVPEWTPYCIGVVLIAGGITYFWTSSKFYRVE